MTLLWGMHSLSSGTSICAYLIGGHHTEVCDGVIVSLNQPSLEGQVALAPSTLVEVRGPPTDGEGQSLVPNWRTLVLVGMEDPEQQSM